MGQPWHKASLTLYGKAPRETRRVDSSGKAPTKRAMSISKHGIKSSLECYLNLRQIYFEFMKVLLWTYEDGTKHRLER